MKSCKGLDCKVEMLSSSSITSYTSALGGAGVTVEIYGENNKDIQKAAKEIVGHIKGRSNSAK